MMLTAYGFSASSGQVSAASQVSQTLKNLILDTYDSISGMTFEYELPENIEGEDYSIEVLDKNGDAVGIVTKTLSGHREVAGASSLSAPLSNTSFGVLKGFGQDLHYICMTKYLSKIYIEGSRCE